MIKHFCLLLSFNHLFIHATSPLHVVRRVSVECKELIPTKRQKNQLMYLTALREGVGFKQCCIFASTKSTICFLSSSWLSPSKVIDESFSYKHTTNFESSSACKECLSKHLKNSLILGLKSIRIRNPILKSKCVHTPMIYSFPSFPCTASNANMSSPPNIKLHSSTHDLNLKHVKKKKKKIVINIGVSNIKKNYAVTRKSVVRVLCNFEILWIYDPLVSGSFPGLNNMEFISPWVLTVIQVLQNKTLQKSWLSLMQ